MQSARGSCTSCEREPANSNLCKGWRHRKVSQARTHRGCSSHSYRGGGAQDKRGQEKGGLRMHGGLITS